jgi:hypothetical protein
MRKEMCMVLRRVGAVSLGKVFGILYALLGLVIGALLALLSLVGAGIGAASGSDQAWFGAFFGVGAIIFLPIFYGILGFIGGLLTGAFYNLAAGMVGGVHVELES